MAVILSILILYITCTNALININLIKDFFEHTGVSRLIMFACNSKLENINIINDLATYNTVTFSVDNLNLNIYQILNTHHIHLGVVLNSSCKNSKMLLEKSGFYNYFSVKHHWLVIGNDEDSIKMFQNITINVNAQVAFAVPDETNNSWKIFDIYNPGYKHGGKLKIMPFGTWNETSRLEVSNKMKESKYWRRKDMSEVTFTGTVVLTYKFNGDLLDYLYKTDENRSVDTINRFHFVVFSYVQEYYKFSLKINLNHLWGKQLKNGSHTGMMGELERREIDLGLSGAYYKKDRVPVVDFLTPTYISRPCFIFIQPKPKFSFQGSFFSPLSMTVWGCTWGVLVVISILMRIVLKQEFKFTKVERNNEQSWSYIILLVVGELCQQDIPNIPNFYSGRILSFTLILFTYILYQFYSDSIVSTLLMETPATITNLKQLFESNLMLGVEDVVYERDYFEQTTDPIAIAIYKYKISGKKNGSDAFYEPAEGLELVSQGGFGYQVDRSAAYKIIADTFPNEVICKLGEVQLYPTQLLTGVCQQDSPFRELLVYGFQILTEAGIVLRQFRHWHAPKPECMKVVDASTINVGIEEFFPVLLIIMTGVIVSVLILCVEMLVFHNKQQSKRIFII